MFSIVCSNCSSALPANTIYSIYSVLLETVSFVLQISQWILKSTFASIFNLKIKIPEHLFKTNCVVIIKK